MVQIGRAGKAWRRGSWSLVPVDWGSRVSFHAYAANPCDKVIDKRLGKFFLVPTSCTNIRSFVVTKLGRDTRTNAAPIHIVSANQYAVSLRVVRNVRRVGRPICEAMMRIKLLPFFVRLVVDVVTKRLFLAAS
jgi:hypothetical protein